MRAETAHAVAQPGSADAPRAAAGRGAEIFSIFSMAYARERREVMSLTEFLEGCRDDPGMTASAAERMIAAIGEPIVVDTARTRASGASSSTARSSSIRACPASSAWRTRSSASSSFFQHAAQGLEERKQILYLLGPVGGGKSSLAERLKELMETQPIYVLAAGDEVSPIFESPLGLFRPETMGAVLETVTAFPPGALTGDLLAVGGQTPGRVRRRHLALLSRQRSIPPSCARSASPKRSPATRTIRTSPRWSARSTSASSSISPSTIPTPTATPAASTARRRACWNSSRCSRPRSRCCTPC